MGFNELLLSSYIFSAANIRLNFHITQTVSKYLLNSGN